MNDEQRTFLEQLPLTVIANYISDAASTDIGVTSTTFMLAMHPLFRDVDPMECWDFCVSLLREQVEENYADNQDDET